MGTRIFNVNYADPSVALHYNGSAASGGADVPLTNAAVATYAQTRRNVLAITLNSAPTTALTISQDDEWVEQVRVPIAGRVTLPGKLKVLIYGKTSADGSGANQVFARCTVGGAQGFIDGFTTSDAWQSTTLTLADSDVSYMTGGGELIIDLRTYGANQTSIKTICAYQPADSTAPAWVDLAGTEVGNDDEPDSALRLRTQRNTIVAVRGNRTRRANVFNHWYGGGRKFSAGYGAANDDLGRYQFVKREGVDNLHVHMCCWGTTTSLTLRAEIAGTTHSDAATTTAFTVQADPMWKTISFAMSSTDITTEQEIELLLDSSTDEAVMCGVCVIEEHISSTAVTHTVPDVTEVQAGDTIHASEHAEIADTMDHLWRRGQSIALSDWRFNTAALETMYCNQTTRDKTDYGNTSSVIARAIVFPSTASKRMFIRVGYKTTTGDSYNKQIEFQLSDSMTDATADETGPGVDSGIIFGNARDDNLYVEAALMDITAGDYETPAGALAETDVPYQVWVFGWTENASEYIIPEWVTIEEVDLAFGEFP